MWTNQDGSTVTLRLDNFGGSRYDILQNTTEKDGTVSITRQIVYPPSVYTRIGVFGRSSIIRFELDGDQLSLMVNEQERVLWDDIQSIDLTEELDIMYANKVISSVQDGSTIIKGVGQLVFYDGFRFYQFDSSN